MSTPTPSPPRVRFGLFELDVAAGELRKSGTLIKLQPQPFRILQLLIERSGTVVTREEIQHSVWNGDIFVDFEHGINFAINQIRAALADDVEKPRYIETLPRRGYRFVAPVEVEEPSQDQARGARAGREYQAATEMGADLMSQAGGTQSGPGRTRWRLTMTAAALGLLVLTALSVWFFTSPVPVPTVRQTVQLTHFGQVETNAPFVTDGVRLYFVERRGGQYGLAQVPIEGGEPTPIPTPFRNTMLYDISPDHTKLLVGSSDLSENALWVLPTSGGSPRRLGEVRGHDAAWSPDGRTIVYILGSSLYLVKADGSDSRKLVNAAAFAMDPRWSPDGHVLRFTVWGPGTTVHSLWEVSADGLNLHRLLAGWREPPTAWGDGELAGGWTLDGRYFLLRSARAGRASVWALREQTGAFRGSSRDPLLLTTSALYLRNIRPGQNYRVYFAGDKESRELARYDARLRQFVPYLSGVSARYVSFSRDGQWVAYVAVPGSTLWRSRLDGSERLQLTFSPMGAGGPQWSPDGKQIAFFQPIPGRQTNRICVISSAGGTPEAVTGEAYDASRPEWSPHGDSLDFTRTLAAPSGQSEQVGIYQIDLKTKQLSLIPGSEGLVDSARSPDGRYVAAMTFSRNTIMLFDSNSGHWRELANGVGLFGLAWSGDGKYVYSQDAGEGSEQPIFRVRISNRKMERIATSGQILRMDVSHFNFLGLVPDGSPLVTLTHRNSDIYALDVDFP